MRIAITIVAVLMGLLSIAAGVAKVALFPEEVAFLDQFGFSTDLTMSFGIVQVAGGLLLMSPRTRAYGSLIVAVAFVLSAVLLFLAGNTAFGAISILPVALAGFVAYHNIFARPETAVGEEDT